MKLIILISSIFIFIAPSYGYKSTDLIHFINPKTNNIWKKKGDSYIFTLNLKNGNLGIYKLQMIGSSIKKAENKNDYELNGGTIAVISSEGMINTIEDAWNGSLTSLIGTVDLKNKGIDSLFFISQYGGSIKHRSYNLLNLREFEIITYTVIIDNKGGHAKYTSRNFYDSRFKAEAEFLKKIADELISSNKDYQETNIYGNKTKTEFRKESSFNSYTRAAQKAFDYSFDSVVGFIRDLLK